MLIEFSVENFRSFREKKTLSMVASKRITGGEAEHLVDIPGTDEKLLRVAAIYGANGAGKSNLVKAIEFALERISEGTKPNEKIPYHPFRLDKEKMEAPTTFSFLIAAGDSVFKYSYSYDSDSVHSEELNRIIGEKRQSIFHRTQSENGKAQIKFGAEFKKSATETIKALKTVGARPNQLFLTEIININDDTNQGELLYIITSFLTTRVGVLHPSSQLRSKGEVLEEVEGFIHFASEFLRVADTGIEHVAVTHQESRANSIPEFILKQLEAIQDRDSVVHLTSSDGSEYLYEGSESITQLVTSTVHKTLNGGEEIFPFSDESDGTQRFLELLLPIYQIQKSNGLLVIDELERSLHPLLAYKFVELFLKGCEEKSTQLIFTTHSTHLLDLALLRRDEIWFTEKDTGGGTDLYPLSDFKVRKDLAIDKGYIQGRYGAIPFLGGFDELLHKRDQSEGQAK